MSKRIARALVALLSFASATAPVHAQGTTASASATTDFRWLAGRWEGRLTGSPRALVEVIYSAPNARSIVGVMRLVQDDTVLVVELISMVDTPAGVEMRFRHFSNQLDAYETQFKQAMRLTSHDAERDVFENEVPYDKSLMSTQPRTTMLIRQGADTFIGRSNIIGSDGAPAIVEVKYQRAR